MNVAIIGCGLIGNKRARALGDARMVACADVVLKRAQSLAALAPGATATNDWREIVERKDIDIAIVATTHDALAQISMALVTAGKHVLVEKPAGLSPEELTPVIDATRDTGALVRVGFNHRYHPSFLKARGLVDEGALGELLFLRARYGHGGRVGYEQEWRADAAVSGGGELIDQGLHLIDLARWFLGDFVHIHGFVHTYFWDMPVEDNAFLLLRTANDQTAFLHASWTEWKNLFSFELYGRDGKLEVDGLGGSYGTERLVFYKMLPQMGPPETMIWEYPMPDRSWESEFSEFLEDIRLQRQPSANLIDARAALRIVAEVYKEAES